MIAFRLILLSFVVVCFVSCDGNRIFNVDENGIRRGVWTRAGWGSDPVVPFERDGKYGFLDVHGRVVMSPRFDWADEFFDGHALCIENSNGIVIDESGTVFGNLPACDTYFRAASNRVWYYVDEKWGLCDLKGEVVVDPQYDDVDAFSDSLARVNIGAEYLFDGAIRGGLNGYIDLDGKVVIDCQFEDYCFDFQEGFTVVGNSLLDHSGHVMFTDSLLANAFSEGLIPAGSYGGTRYLDKNGELQFEVAGSGDAFSEGLAVVRVDESEGFIDKKGKFVIEPRFARAEQFSNGLAAVNVGDWKWGYIDKTCNLAVPAVFNQVLSAEKDYAIVHYGGEFVHTTATTYLIKGRWLMIDHLGRPLAVISEDDSEL